MFLMDLPAPRVLLKSLKSDFLSWCRSRLCVCGIQAVLEWDEGIWGRWVSPLLDELNECGWDL